MMTAARPLVHAIVFENTFALGDFYLFQKVLWTKYFDPSLSWAYGLATRIFKIKILVHSTCE